MMLHSTWLLEALSISMPLSVFPEMTLLMAEVNREPMESTPVAEVRLVPVPALKKRLAEGAIREVFGDPNGNWNGFPMILSWAPLLMATPTSWLPREEEPPKSVPM